MTQSKQIGLILNVLDVTAATPVDIIPCCILRRPESRELATFRARLEEVAPSIFVNFEHAFPATRVLDPEEWRYWVVEETGRDGVVGFGLRNVSMISRLFPVEFRCDNLFILAHNRARGRKRLPTGLGAKIGMDPFAHLGHPIMPKPLDSQLIVSIGGSWNRFANLSPECSAIRSAVERFHDLGAIHPVNDLYGLGVFGIIESILTHDPRKDYDSLTHQIKTKMSLLDSRFEAPLDYACFLDANKDKAWKALYGYRSALAHGRAPDFMKDLRILKDRKNVVEFLDMATKSLLRYALREPQLVLDLQKC